jgi:hypothetical protein
MDIRMKERSALIIPSNIAGQSPYEYMKLVLKSAMPPALAKRCMIINDLIPEIKKFNVQQDLHFRHQNPQLR